MDNVTFHDHKPEALSLYDAVVDGLSREDKSIPPKFFYDERGSKLFERICKQPEYYPPTVERRMLTRLADEIASLTGTGRILIEPGAGSASKVRLLLDVGLLDFDDDDEELDELAAVVSLARVALAWSRVAVASRTAWLSGPVFIVAST